MKKDLRQSGNYRQFMKQIGWMSVGIDASESSQRNYLYVKKLPLLGSFVKGLRLDWPIDFGAIDKVVKKYRGRWVKLSFNLKSQIPNPKSTTKISKLMENYDYQVDNSPLIPTKTVILDLRKSRRRLWREMKKDCRYAIKKAEKNGLAVQLNGDINKFSQEFHRWRWFKGFSPLIKPQEKEIIALKQAFAADCIDVSIRRYGNGRNGDGHDRGKDDQMVAGALFLKHHDSFHYWLAFTSRLGRKLMAQYLAVWTGIKLAKRLGCQVFDFEGIADERFSKAFQSWKGFSHFKQSFGGKTLNYSQSHVKLIISTPRRAFCIHKNYKEKGRSELV